jgi:hypothetical protein
LIWGFIAPVESATLFLAVVVNRVRRVLAAELSNCSSKTRYDKEECVKLLQRAFDNMFRKCIQRGDYETSPHEALLQQNAKYSLRI